jgi:hypothetical protein
MPAHDAESVGDSVDESVSFEVAVVSAGDGDEARGSRVRCGHGHECVVDLVDVIDEVWSAGNVTSVEPDPFGAAGIARSGRAA